MSVSNRLFKQSRRLPQYQPLPWKTFFLHVAGKDAVLWIALALALASSLITRPTAANLADAIDWKTLGCLASLMAASGGFMISGVFDYAAAKLTNRCHSTRSLMTVMVLATFLASMFITNDVALIVLVPMSLLAFHKAGVDPMLTVILQTVAANVGSILLPMGNPQNLFLYSHYHMTFAPFFRTVLPLSLAGLLALSLFCLFAKPTALRTAPARQPFIRARDAGLYGCLFLAASLAVFDLVDYRAALALAVAVMAFKGRNLAQQVDYALLATFVGFFIFVGNIARIPHIAALLERFAEAGTYMAAVVSSQLISNVPAAVLLSGFTDDSHALLAGVSAGGCGTLIASMASLISYKLYARDGGNKRRFLLKFTLINILFLAVMTGARVWVRI